MAVNKFNNEKNIMKFFLIAAIVVFGLSVWFLITSMNAEEIGGGFISAMLLFISGYALIVFTMRLARYRFLTKLQRAILVDGVRKVSELQSLFKKSNTKINRELQFMINSGFLEDFNVLEEEVIYSEREVSEQRKKEHSSKQAEQQLKIKEEKVPRKQVIKSQKCPNCGAKIDFNNKSEVDCPYCGNHLTK